MVHWRYLKWGAKFSPHILALKSSSHSRQVPHWEFQMYWESRILEWRAPGRMWDLYNNTLYTLLYVPYYVPDEKPTSHRLINPGCWLSVIFLASWAAVKWAGHMNKMLYFKVSWMCVYQKMSCAPDINNMHVKHLLCASYCYAAFLGKLQGFCRGKTSHCCHNAQSTFQGRGLKLP